MTKYIRKIISIIQHIGKTMSISTLQIKQCKLVPTATVSYPQNLACANVNVKPFYMHENQCTQILNLLITETKNKTFCNIESLQFSSTYPILKITQRNNFISSNPVYFSPRTLTHFIIKKIKNHVCCEHVKLGKLWKGVLTGHHNSSSFFKNWDSLHAQIKKHNKTWSYKERNKRKIKSIWAKC